uniref:Mitochondrial import inner membrane translocase subunit TIM50 n=1 Tax=Onchocerca volvulus TaxID=6282 RepID=A0A8R1TWD1_ONCVO
MFISSVSIVRASHRCISRLTSHQTCCTLCRITLTTKSSSRSAPGILTAWSLGYPSINKADLRMLNDLKGIGRENEDFVEKGGEKMVRKAKEDVYGYTEASLPPKMNVKPNIIVTKWEILMNRCGLPIDRTAPKEDQNAQKRKRSTVLAMFFVAGSTFSGLLYFCLYYGNDCSFDSYGRWMKRDENSAHTGILAPYYRIKEAYRSWRNFVIEPSRDKLLPDPLKPPYWQPKYTVVIELKNVLVAPEWSYKMGNRVKKRPAVDYLLDVIGYPNFEVVIYTTETALNANPIVEALDSKQKIMYKLYRDCCKYMNGVYVKDLSKLNRDLSKVIYIDFDPESFRFNPENVLRLPKWDGTLDDTALVDLAELLKTIHLSDVDDVRPTLQYYSQFDDPLKEFRERATRVAELEKKMHQMESEKEAFIAPVKKYQGRLFGFRRHE